MREGKQNANERQILITRTGTLSVELLNRKVHWHEGQIQAEESYEQLVDNILHVMRKVEMSKYMLRNLRWGNSKLCERKTFHYHLQLHC